MPFLNCYANLEHDSSVGRFINEDTYEGDITNPLSLNLYAYVDNNPLTRWDPTGHGWLQKLSGFLDAIVDSITFGGWDAFNDAIGNYESESTDYKESYAQTVDYVAATADNLNAFAPGEGLYFEASIGLMMSARYGTTVGHTPQILKNQQVGNAFDVYVEGTKLKNLDKLGRIGYQEEFSVTGLGQKAVRPDYTIYNEAGDLIAIADAKTSNYIGYDDQAKGFLQIAQKTKSQTIIYYTPTGGSTISSDFLNEANRIGVTIQQVKVK